jgi:adenylate cyclase
VGDTVNLASRIQGVTKNVGVDILISATTRASLPDDFALEKLPAFTVKGKKDPVEIFKVL